MTARRMTALALVFSAVALARADAPSARACAFAEKPKLVKDGGTYTITFAAKGRCDVTVAVADRAGRIVRHLAAGVLGENAPEPLKKNSLTQSLVWDGKDDFGDFVGADLAGMTVHVGLGLTPRFDRMLGDDPTTLGTVRGLAVGTGGELFVLNLGHHLHLAFGSTVCTVLDRNGGYRRTIMPYHRRCFPARVKPFGVLDLGDKGVYPWLHANHLKSIYPFTGEPAHQRPLVLPDGRFLLSMRVRGKGAVLVAVDAADGGIPETGAFGPALGDSEMTGHASLALAGDGETLLLSGAASQKRWKPLTWKHAVYRAKWADEQITPFIGDPAKAGAGEKGLNQPQGVAVDKAGRIYVADRGNNRVAVFAAEGKFLGELPVESPYMLDVHRTSGAVYVLAKGDPPEHIVKFTSWRNPRPAYSAKIPRLLRALKGKKRTDAYPVLALDDSGADPVLWVGSATAYDRFRLYRFLERDGTLGEPQEQGRGGGYRSCRAIHVDRKRDEVYLQLGGDIGVASRHCRFLRINGADGKVLSAFPEAYGRKMGILHAFGQDGYLYFVRSKRICRYDRELKPAPFAGTESNESEPIPGHRYAFHLMGRGMAVGRDGTMYLLHENLPQVHQRYGVSLWGPDGKLRKKDLVGSLSQGAVSLRIDPAGNLYVGDPVKPDGQIVPRDLQGKVDTAKKRRGQANNHYPIMYGSILKFPPTGGAGVGPDVDGRKGVLAYDAPVGIQGDLWQYFGVGPIPAYKGGTYKHYAFGGCSCEGMRFDVDAHGRTFAPDAARFRVIVLDTNGNEICFFGGYGNRDSPGGGSAGDEPTIPLAWPAAVGVSDRAVYVSDLLNRRVVRVRLDYAAEAACTIE